MTNVVNQPYLLFLETSGNQAYIYSTNKMRDIIGASELTYKVGTEFVEEALNKTFGEKEFVFDTFKKDPSLTPKIEDGKAFEVMLATSGKAMILFAKMDKAREFITCWSRIVLQKAPGIDATAVFCENPIDLDLKPNAKKPNNEDSKENGIACNIAWAVKDAHHRFEAARTLRRSPMARFARLPIVAPCKYSGLPASDSSDWEGGDTFDLSIISKTKMEARWDFSKRINPNNELFYAPHKIEDAKEDEKHFRKYLQKLEEKGWLAVVHADGNGLGEVFMNFDEHVGNDENPTAREYITDYRNFSMELDKVTHGAFQDALNSIEPFKEKTKDGKTAKYYPIVPIILGGDDITAIVDGQQALGFTTRFLRTFKALSGEKPTIKKIARKAFGGEASLGICAGVCIAKPHYPFSTAYHMAEQLIRNAKVVKTYGKPASVALDFHILYDSNISSMDEIRSKLEKDGKYDLTSKPFVLDFVADSNKPEGENWCKQHDWNLFTNAVEAFKAKKDDKPALPSSQSHMVREALHIDPAQAEKEWEILMSRYGTFKEKWGCVYAGEKLFDCVKNKDKNEDKKNTIFQDALEAVEFIEHPEKQAGETVKKNDCI